MLRCLDNYMKIMKKRFYVLKRIILDRRTPDQSVQQIRQIRTFPREHTFSVGNLVYLFAPSTALFQKRSKRFKED